jgi:hypothetical protein
MGAGGMMTNRWIVAVDIGQAIDPTAVAVLQVSPPRNISEAVTPHDLTVAHAKQSPPRVDVRHLERLPLRMPYTAQIEIIAGILRRPPLDRAPVDLVLDQTGVGRPVFDMFRRAGLRPIGVTITAGDGESQVDADNFRVSKLTLVSRLQALLHGGELRIAKELTEAAVLAREMSDFRATFSEATGYVRWGAREGTHDDLVLAVAIGAWWAGRARPAVRFSTYSI